MAQGLEIGSHLLQRNNVKTRDDFGYTAEGMEVSLGIVGGCGLPFDGKVTKGTKVSRCNEQVGIEDLSRDFPV